MRKVFEITLGIFYSIVAFFCFACLLGEYSEEFIDWMYYQVGPIVGFIGLFALKLFSLALGMIFAENAGRMFGVELFGKENKKEE